MKYVKPISILLIFLICNCQSEKDKINQEAKLRIWRGEQAIGSRKPWDEQLQASNITTEDMSQLMRIVSMSGEEMQHRLGSYRQKMQYNFSFNRGAKRYEQGNILAIHFDSDGNFHIKTGSEKDQAEYYLISGDNYIKLDNGPFRKGSAISQPITIWRDLPTQNLHEVFTLLKNYLLIKGPTLINFNNRSAYRYDLAFNGSIAAPQKPTLQDTDGGSDFHNWTSKIYPTGILGEIVIDQKTNVILKIQLNARMDVYDRPVHMTSIQLSLKSDISDISNAGLVEKPENFVPSHERLEIYRGGKYFTPLNTLDSELNQANGTE